MLVGTENFRVHERSLEIPIGAPDAKWLEGQTRLAHTHDWSVYADLSATNLPTCLIAVIMDSPGGEEMFWSAPGRAREHEGGDLRAKRRRPDLLACSWVCPESSPSRF